MFVHLHTHSEYSLLEGAIKVKSLVKRAKELGMPAVALTDNAVMYGAIEFYLACQSEGIKPIIGCELYLTDDITEKKRGFDRIVLLCKSFKGYQNLIELVTIAHLEGMYYKPRADWQLLRRFSEDIIAISPGNRGPVAYQLRGHNPDMAEAYAKRLKEIYQENFYLGLQKMNLPLEEMVNEGIIGLSKSLDIPVVATNDVYYLQQEDAFLRQVLMSIQTGKPLEEDTRIQFESNELTFRTPEEMAERFKDIPEAIENTLKIAEACNVTIKTDQVQLPRFECPDNKSSEVYLEELVWDGIKKKYGEITEELKARVSFELQIINSMQYAPYFLIIHDFLAFCEQESIPVGPGRGSAAGSIVAYALNITQIDPIKYNLLFERFLNPERVSMPDIDLDFCIRRRGEVIEYIVQKYGKENVSQIITFGTMAARGVVRDVGRALNVPLAEVDRIAKLIPSTPGQYTSIPEALEQIPDLKKAYEGSDEIKELLDVGMKLEGFSRHTSTHAAGVVISRDPLTTILPLTTNEGQVSTQYDMGIIEKIGLLKMDILGLRNLTMMQDCLKLIQQTKQETVDLGNLPMDDSKTYQLLQKGETIGIFQCEGKGMRQLIKDLKPQVFEDIIALLALYRPGPLGSGMVNEFISNKSGKTEVKYELDVLEPILKETYGMIVYQEQVMQIASTVGGFSLGQADMMRRAMGKKKKDVMDQLREEFLEGAEKSQFNKQKAEHIFDLCYKFAEYGFNKSHSAAYALISYQTAYLKAHYPIEYMAALLTSVKAFPDKAAIYIEEARRMGIEILPPSVNHSFTEFSVEDEAIRIGMGAIRNVGEGAIESIVTERQKAPFKSLQDFCLKVNLSQVNKRVVESLIKAGACDEFAKRAALLSIYEKVLDSAQSILKERASGQIGLFGGGSDDTALMVTTDETGYEEISPIEKLKMEKDMLGLYITGHPLDFVKDKLSPLKYNSETIPELKPEYKETVRVGGILTECRKVITKAGKEMLIGRMTDLHGDMTVMMFEGDNFESAQELFQDDNIVFLEGRARVKEEETSIAFEKIMLLEKGHGGTYHIDLNNLDDILLFQKIKELTTQYHGTTPLYFHVNDTTILANKKFWVAEDPGLLTTLKEMVGTGHVWVG